MVFSNKVYDILVWIAQYFLPASGTLYFALAKTWGLPYGAEVVGTITAVDTFLGVILGISKSNYKGDGVLEINEEDPEKDLYNLRLFSDPEDLAEKKSITFKVETK